MGALRLASAALAAVAVGCGGPEEASEGALRPDRTAVEQRKPAPLPQVGCPPRLAGCRTATGRIVFVERVDPDGDGDAHFVLAGPDSVTAPGVSVVDVRRNLRPRPLPRAGDRLSAAGPVFTGSYGQRQIEAVEVLVQRR